MPNSHAHENDGTTEEHPSKPPVTLDPTADPPPPQDPPEGSGN